MTTWKPTRDPGDWEPKRLGDSLDRVTRRLGGPSAKVLGGVFSRWEEIVGSEVAAHAQPRTLKNGVLSVVVDQPAWATQLRYFGGSLLSKVAEVVGPGEVSEIVIRVASDSVGKTGRSPRR